MHLFIDGDAFPNRIKQILLRALQRKQLAATAISNQPFTLGRSPAVKYETVAAGPDEADNRIVELCGAGDLVITADIPLADRVITKGALVLDHRGEQLDHNNIKTKLAMRNLLQEARDCGIVTKGAGTYSDKDARLFADGLNRILSNMTTPPADRSPE